MTRFAAGLAALTLGLCSPPAVATNGYFAHGYSLAQKALGGAGTASLEDPLVATINPASTAFAPPGFTASLSLFTPIRDYRASERGDNAGAGVLSIAPGMRRSHNEYFPIPAVNYGRRLGDWGHWGVAMFGNGGLNTEFQDHSARFAEGVPGMSTECFGTFGGGPVLEGSSDPAGFCGERRGRAGVDMAILFLAPHLAVKLGERSAVGLMPIAALNRFAAHGLAALAPFSNQPDKVTGNGHDLAFGGGYRVGLVSAVIPGVRLGASYQSRIRMSEFDDYAGLFAEQGDFDVPESWNLGAVLRLTARHQLLFDYQRIDYNQIRSVGNSFDSSTFMQDCALPRLSGDDSPSPACLGAATGPGFGWQDMSIYKFGYQFAADRWKLRLGYSTTEQPIPSDEILFNVLAPGVVERHYTAGLAWRWSQSLNVELAAMFAPDRPVRGRNPLSNVDLTALDGGLPTGNGGEGGAFEEDENDQRIVLNMRQYELSLGLTWRFD